MSDEEKSLIRRIKTVFYYLADSAGMDLESYSSISKNASGALSYMLAGMYQPASDWLDSAEAILENAKKKVRLTPEELEAKLSQIPTIASLPKAEW